MRSVLKRILMKMTQMHSVTAVSILIRKHRPFIWGREIITRQLADLSAVIHSPEEVLIRLAWIFILIVEIIRLGMLIQVDIVMLHCLMAIKWALIVLLMLKNLKRKRQRWKKERRVVIMITLLLAVLIVKGYRLL